MVNLKSIAQYITKAEHLTRLACPAPNSKSMVVKGFPHLDLYGDFKDLHRYRAENVIAQKLILATDTKGNAEKVVIKVLPKTCFNTRNAKRSLLPTNVKHMTKLLRYY